MKISKAEKDFSFREEAKAIRYLMLNLVLLIASEGDRGLVKHVPRLLAADILRAAGVLRLLGVWLGRPAGNRVLHVAARSNLFGDADEGCDEKAF